MLYESELWCVKENEMTTSRRTEKAMTRAVSGVKVIDKKNSKELIDLLVLAKIQTL